MMNPGTANRKNLCMPEDATDTELLAAYKHVWFDLCYIVRSEVQA